MESSAELSQSLNVIQTNGSKIESESSQESTPSSVISFKSRSPHPETYLRPYRRRPLTRCASCSQTVFWEGW
eukprot:UN02857